MAGFSASNRPFAAHGRGRGRAKLLRFSARARADYGHMQIVVGTRSL